MKVIVVVAALIWASQASAAKLYAFEGLSAQHHDVPVAIDVALNGIASKPIQECQKQLRASDEEMRHYFTAIPVRLSVKRTAVLVLPTRYCYPFFGAHAIAFWLFEVESQRPRMLLASVQDTMEVGNRFTNGLPDITTRYGSFESHLYRYNGKQYTEQPK